MDSRLSEILVLLGSLMKWLVLASIVGLLVGLSTTQFLKALNFGLHAVALFPYAPYLLPVGLLISGWITFTLSPEAQGHGTERVVQAIHTRSGQIPSSVIPAKLAATLLTITVGGSAGNVGPCAQIGAGLCSLFAGALKIHEDDRKKLVICGLSAGFSAVFGTPVAGALFGIEVLCIGQFSYAVLLPSIVASLIANHVADYWHIAHFSPAPLTLPVVDSFLFLQLIVAGCLFGGCAVLFIETMKLTTRLAVQWLTPGPVKGAAGGLLLLALASVFSWDALGLGYETIQKALAGENILWYGFFLKILATSITLSFGGSGGVILPICFVGATAGSVIAGWVHLDPALLAALGLAGTLAGTANVPLTGIVLAMELFGPSIAPHAAVICAIAYLLSGHRSIIPTQILQAGKTDSLLLEAGQAIHDARPTVHLRPSPVARWMQTILRPFVERKNDREEQEKKKP